MKKNRIFALLLAAILLLTLAACGTTAEETAEETAVVEETEEEVVTAEETAAAEEGTEESSRADIAASYPEGSAAAELALLYAEGYEMGACTFSDDLLKVNYVNQERTDFLLVTCVMTQEQCDEFFSIDFMAEDYDQQCLDYLADFSDLAIGSREEDLPDPALYECFAGKTLQEIVDAGCDYAGCSEDAEGVPVMDFYLYEADENTYLIRVYPVEEPEDGFYDDESVLALTADRVIFWDFN